MQISTRPHKINTPEPIDKNSAQFITSARGPPIPNLVEIHPLGLLGKWVKYKKKYYLFMPFFSDSLLIDFYTRQLKRRKITQGCAFWGYKT